MPLVVSVMGFSRDELADAGRRASGERDEVALIELNVSCPNVETGLVMGADPAETARAVERVRPLTEQAADREAHARTRPTRPRWRAAAEEAGADAVSLINTLKGMALDPRDRRAVARRRHRRRVGPGGAGDRAGAGAARSRGAVGIPVIGMGGIAIGRDAADFLAAGAACVAVGTESFRDPAAGRRIGAELAELGPSAARVDRPSAATCPIWGTVAVVSPETAGSSAPTTTWSICSKPLQTTPKTLKVPATSLKLRLRSS